MQEQSFTTNTSEETMALGARLVEALSKEEGMRGTSTILALSGDLGAGKTVLTKGIAQALGVEASVTSPTFVLQKRYALPEGAAWKRLIHIDAYRLESAQEFEGIGWHDIATDPGNLIVVEWPEQAGGVIPERAIEVTFEEQGEQGRRIIFNSQFSIFSQ